MKNQSQIPAASNDGQALKALLYTVPASLLLWAGAISVVAKVF